MSPEGAVVHNMPGFFEIEKGDIQRLDPLQLTALLECLISNELAEHGIRRTSGYVSLDINVPDDGADGLVSITAEAVPQFPQLDHIHSRNTVFQAKSGTLKPAQFVSELFVKKRGAQKDPKKLKERVKDVVENEGAYVFFYGKTCTAEARKVNIKAMHEAIAELYPDKKPLDITILDCSQIATWSNQYLAAIIRVSHWARRANIQEFIDWQNWSKYEFFGNTFIPNTKAIEYIELDLTRFGGHPDKPGEDQAQEFLHGDQATTSHT